MERVTATYLVETPFDVLTAAETLAGEQSSGTFVAVPGETESLRERFSARVEQVELLDSVNSPSLPSTGSLHKEYHQAKITVSWSVENFGYNLPAIVSTVQGNLFELRQFTGIKLLDLDVPTSFGKHFSGPRFGIDGTRELAGVADRPLIGTIIKPSIGMSPNETAAIVAELIEAGIDFIKDDELMADPPHSPFDERVRAIMSVINDHAQRSGKKVMYAFNISDEIDRMLSHYETVEAHAGTCVLLSLNSVGLAGVKKVCDSGRLAVHGHRNGWGMLNRHPMLGIEFPAYQKIWRLAGVDQIHVNGISNKFWESDDSVVRSIESCHRPFLGGRQILPVLSSGQWGGQAFETYRRIPSVDLLYLAGGGILAHPDGAAAGVTAIRQAWDAASAGLTYKEALAESPALRRSAEKFDKHHMMTSPKITAEVS